MYCYRLLKIVKNRCYSIWSVNGLSVVRWTCSTVSTMNNMERRLRDAGTSLCVWLPSTVIDYFCLVIYPNLWMHSGGKEGTLTINWHFGTDFSKLLICCVWLLISSSGHCIFVSLTFAVYTVNHFLFCVRQELKSYICMLLDCQVIGNQ